jgi:hypothetical protein
VATSHKGVTLQRSPNTIATQSVKARAITADDSLLMFSVSQKTTDLFNQTIGPFSGVLQRSDLTI